jgi:hypothetical protein
MRRSAGFMTRSRPRQLVAAANGPYIKRVRRSRQNRGALRAGNRAMHEH